MVKHIPDVRRSWRHTFLLGITVILCGASPAQSPSPTSSPFPRPAMSAMALNPKSLLQEFMAAQRSDLKALEHRYKFEMKELKTSQDARSKEFKSKEDEARHKFFDEHEKGTERRTYVQDFIQRSEAFRKSLAKELTARKQEQETHLAAVKVDYASKLAEFKKAIAAGAKPAAALWPGLGH
jgi:hypothetical protein